MNQSVARRDAFWVNFEAQNFNVSTLIIYIFIESFIVLIVNVT